MRRSALVEVDELVCLGAAQAAAPGRQDVQSVPLCTVGGDERVDLHRVPPPVTTAQQRDYPGVDEFR